LVVTTVKSSASAISSMFGGSVEGAVDDAGFCAPSFVAVVPPWEQCISAATVTF
jgi:hypothetical protein